jgi:hypothetical protein
LELEPASLASRLPAASAARASRFPDPRSKVSRRPLVVAGIDGRSPGARRYRELLSSFVASLGGDLNAAEMALARNAVSLTLQSELLQTDIAAGRAVDSEQLTRLSNAVSRIMAQLGKRKRPPQPSSSPLLDHFSRPPEEEVS